MSNLGNPNTKIVYSAITSLGLLGDSSATEPLNRCLTNQDSGIRNRAKEALRRIRNKKVMDSLLDDLDNPDMNVRKDSIVALSLLKDEQVVDHIAKFISEIYPIDVRIAAIQALGSLKSYKYIAELKWIRDFDANKIIVEAATNALNLLQKFRR